MPATLSSEWEWREQKWIDCRAKTRAVVIKYGGVLQYHCRQAQKAIRRQLRSILSGREASLAVTGRTTATLPVEVWECILDHLWDHKRTLKVCVIVCKDWYPRSQYHLRRKITLSDRHDIVKLGTLMRSVSWKAAAVQSISLRDCSYIGSFAAMLAGRLPHLKSLVVGSRRPYRWEPSVIHPDIFLYMSAFPSITHLYLCHITFPSIQTFQQVVYSLHNIQYLHCTGVGFDRGSFRARYFPKRCHSNLACLSLNVEPEAFHEITNFLVDASLVTKLTKVVLGDLIFSNRHDDCAGTTIVQRLLHAAGTSLLDLHIRYCGYRLQKTLRTINNRVGSLARERQYSAPFTAHQGYIIHNSNLENLRLWIDADIFAQKDLSGGYATWMYDLFSQVSQIFKNLREVRVVLDVRYHLSSMHTWLPESPDLLVDPLAPGSRLDRIYNMLDNHLCSFIDEALSNPQLLSLERAVFQIQDSNHGFSALTPNLKKWRKHLSKRLPKLSARGILIPMVTIDLIRHQESSGRGTHYQYSHLVRTANEQITSALDGASPSRPPTYFPIGGPPLAL